MPAGPTPLRSEKTHFAMAPEWVVESVSPRALQCYMTLWKFADRTTGLCHPSRTTLAKLMKCTPSTVDRALDELSEEGAIRVEGVFHEDGYQTSNRYWLRFNDPSPSPGSPSSNLETPSAGMGTPPTHECVTPLFKNDEQTRTTEQEPEIKRSLPPAAERAPVSLMPKKTAITKEWLEEIRPEWSPKLRDFDEVIAFAMNSEYLRKKPDKQAYILGQLKRAVAREASSAVPRTTQRPRVIARPDDPNNFNNW